MFSPFFWTHYIFGNVQIHPYNFYSGADFPMNYVFGDVLVNRQLICEIHPDRNKTRLVEIKLNYMHLQALNCIKRWLSD